MIPTINTPKRVTTTKELLELTTKELKVQLELFNISYLKSSKKEQLKELLVNHLNSIDKANKMIDDRTTKATKIELKNTTQNTKRGNNTMNNKNTVNEIKEQLKELKVTYDNKATKEQLLTLLNDTLELKELHDILISLDDKATVNKKANKDYKEDKATLENRAVPLMLALITAKRATNVIFSALSKKEQLKQLKSSLGSKNNLSKDTLTFLLHNNLTYDNTINIANIRGINTLISKSINVKSKIKELKATIELNYNEVLALELKSIRALEKKRLANELKQLKKDSLELKELKAK